MPQTASAPDTIDNLEVAAVFMSYPPDIRTRLIFIRQLVLETAAALEGVGELEETLKWGEPSYLTPKAKSGSTIRMAWKPALEDQYAIYFKCTANLVEAFKERYPRIFTYGGTRCLLFRLDEEVPVHELQRCIALALTYHRNKKLENSARWEMVEQLLQNQKTESKNE